MTSSWASGRADVRIATSGWTRCAAPTRDHRGRSTPLDRRGFSPSPPSKPAQERLSEPNAFDTDDQRLKASVRGRRAERTGGVAPLRTRRAPGDPRDRRAGGNCRRFDCSPTSAKVDILRKRGTGCGHMSRSCTLGSGHNRDRPHGPPAYGGPEQAGCGWVAGVGHVRVGRCVQWAPISRRHTDAFFRLGKQGRREQCRPHCNANETTPHAPRRAVMPAGEMAMSRSQHPRGGAHTLLVECGACGVLLGGDRAGAGTAPGDSQTIAPSPPRPDRDSRLAFGLATSDLRRVRWTR